MAVDIVTPSARLVSESTRERETYKYDPSLLSSIRYNDDGAPIPSAELVTSADTVLTALSQLGACRLNAARSLISLFDQNYQYIVAEATPTMPLLPSLKHEDRGEDLWLCGTAIPRVHGVCEYTLAVNDPTQFEGGDDPSKLPLALVSDLTSDVRFSSKPYCRPGTPARFYAAVPIRSHRGINIGVYCVIDTEPRDLSTWDEKSTELMRNISRSLMEHLEFRRSSQIYARHGRMIRGLGSLAEGKESLSGWRDAGLGLNGEVPLANGSEQNGNIHAEHLATAEGRDRAASITGERSYSPERIRPASGHSTKSATHKAESSSGRRQTIQDVFTRAANILREAIDVEGFIALDASTGSSGVLSSPRIDADEDPHAIQSQSPSAASGDEAGASRDHELACRVLGSSTSSIAGYAPPTEVPQKFLSRLFRRYPSGKVFNFNILGDMQSSDSSGDEGTPTRSNSSRPGAGGAEDEAATTAGRQRSPWSRRAEGSTIRSIFPGARSVAFVPIWDAKRSRWFAGGFAYTYKTTRIFTIEGELSYLRAFGVLTMEESFRVETQLADKAKDDVLNSLSHELRSPLHGILAASELLNDTNLDVFQANIMHTMETCSRTLLDTVEHLLAFSKVNSYVGRMKLRKNTVRAPGIRQGLNGAEKTNLKGLYAHTRLDILAAEVMESVFAGFNFQHASLSQLTKQQSATKLADADANRRLDSMRAMEELGPGNIENGQLRLDMRNVSIFLDVDPACSWVFNTQPGALRRIIMNLFGNSLKYTRHGSIVVSLKQDKARRRDRLRTIRIAVSDTGKGIGEDYLQHDLFKPFSQEDPLAVGTGLGLSLVNQIAAQLKGKITVDSRVGVGTTVTVTLPLLPGNPEIAALGPSGDDEDFVQAVSELAGQRVRLVGFRQSADYETNDNGYSRLSKFDDYALTESICRDWLKLDVVNDSELPQTAPTLIIYMEASLEKPVRDLAVHQVVPSIVICANALESFQRSSAPGAPDGQGLIEKLAKAMALALKQSQVRQRQAQKAPKPPLGVLTSSLVSRVTTVAASILLTSKVEESQPATALTVSAASISLETKDPPPVSVPPTAAPSISTKPKSPVFLLVDDNPINLKILSSYMKKIGHSYATATNGLEAVEAFCEDPAHYKCIFMDITMPIMDGFEATRRIRAHEREQGLKALPIFALSGLASASAQQEALESGIDLFLTKPVILKELGVVLETRGLL
ncbi:hypothetical protein GQ53DRAFT_869088 [Thozetella sp. PMI_491]|nr:hypothetical protein GQ53DRAFT_869088 [Thozetella sp. PMI_491]